MENEKMKPLCIYHGNCADGFGAAWAVRQYFGDGAVDFHPGVYGQEPPDLTDRDVILVDFSYKRPVLDAIAAKASSILILDHHKTAAEDLAGLPEPEDGYAPDRWRMLQAMHGAYAVRAVFDMSRSGAMIAWDFFMPSENPPPLLCHIQDRDLWLFKLEGTREIQANVFSYPYDFEVWDRLMEADPAQLIAEGRAIERKHFKDIGELVGVCKRRMVIGGYDVPVANLPYTLTSDAGNIMAEGEPFAATYFDKEGERVFSLRSKPGGADVSEIAKAYGGGGHKNASGFRVPIGWEGERQPTDR